MMLKILIDHEFSDPIAFAMFASGYADLCRSVGIVPKSAAAEKLAERNTEIKSASIAPTPITPAPAEDASEEQAPQPAATPKRRGRPSAAEIAARKEAETAKAPEPAAEPTESEPVKDAAPNAAEPAKPEATSDPATVSLDDVRAALQTLIVNVEGGEEIAAAIKAEFFPKQKLVELDGDTLAKVHAALTAKLA